MFEDKDQISKARALRPFYFIVVVWGKRYTDFLLNFCIASLLSPNNIPALLNSGNKFLIATTDEDWAQMQTRPMFQLLKQYVEPVFIRIPPYQEGVSACLHMGLGHKLATHMAFKDRAYAAILTPDLMVSDGTVAAMQRHAVNGIQVVLTAALRFGEEPLFEHLKHVGIAAFDSPSGDEARPIVATGRQLVSAGIRSFHSETLCYEWESPYLANFPVALWWRVPEEDGIIVHSLSWAPLLIDYDAVEHHDSSVMDNWTIDGDYIHRNFGLNGRVHVVQDSDELMLISWAPLSDREESLLPKRRFTLPLIGNWMKELTLFETLSSPVFDLLKREIFPRPVYWHARDLDQKRWGAIAKKALDIVSYGLGKPLALKNRSVWSTKFRNLSIRMKTRTHTMIVRSLNEWSQRSVSFMARIHYFPGVFLYYWKMRWQVLNLMVSAIKGNSSARKRIVRSFQIVTKGLIGLMPKAENEDYKDK